MGSFKNLKFTQQQLAIGAAVGVFGVVLAVDQNSRNQILADCNSGNVSVCESVSKSLRSKITNREYLAKPAIKAANNCITKNWCADSYFMGRDLTLLSPELKAKLDNHIEKWETENKAAVAEAAAKRKIEAAKRAERATWGDWRYSTDIEASTGKPEKMAMISSENSINLDFPYSGRQKAKLVLISSQRRGFNVLVQLDQGQILCNTYRNSNLLVRFDDGPAVPYRCTSPSDNSTESVFIRNEGEFEAGMKGAKKAHITLNMYQNGSKTMTFKVKGYDSSKV